MDYMKKIAFYLFYYIILILALAFIISFTIGSTPDRLMIYCISAIIGGFVIVIVILLNISKQIEDLKKK